MHCLLFFQHPAPNTKNMFNKILQTADVLRPLLSRPPVAGIILGSGLGPLADAVEVEHRIPYAEIPNFPVATVVGHKGELILGNLAGKPIMMLAGRFHYYEGYSMAEVTFPVRVMRALGAETLILSNAAGAMNPDYCVGDIVLLRDHINLFPEHPLRGANDDRLGPRFPDMSAPYTPDLLKAAQGIAGKLDLKVHTGVYAGLQGPTYETRAEYEWLHRTGADVVGMSTVPEVIVAVHGGMRVLAASIVTDIGIREEENTVSHEEVLQAAAEAAPRLCRLFTEVVATL